MVKSKPRTWRPIKWRYSRHCSRSRNHDCQPEGSVEEEQQVCSHLIGTRRRRAKPNQEKKKMWSKTNSMQFMQSDSIKGNHQSEGFPITRHRILEERNQWVMPQPPWSADTARRLDTVPEWGCQEWSHDQCSTQALSDGWTCTPSRLKQTAGRKHRSAGWLGHNVTLSHHISSISTTPQLFDNSLNDFCEQVNWKLNAFQTSLWYFVTLRICWMLELCMTQEKQIQLWVETISEDAST